MENWSLLTRDGEYVTTVVIPSFVPRADVIIWGSRVFVYRFNEYREGMAFYATEEVEKEE